MGVCVVATVAPAQDPGAGTSAQANMPAQTFSLFGQAEPPPLPAQPAESTQEIRRPEMPRPANTRSGSEALQRRTSNGLTWRVRDLLPLAAVLGVIACAALLLKRFMPARRMLGGAGVLEVLARTPVGPKQNVVLVRMGRRMVLLGVTAENVNPLCIVEDPNQVAELLGEAASSRPNSASAEFQRSFLAEAQQFVDSADDDPLGEAGGQVRGLLEKVRRMKKGRDVA
jgi:flagellar biosynthetic protein FliO